MIKVMFGQARVFAGAIYLDGVEQPVTRPEVLVRNGIAYVPQLANVFPSLSVRENLELGTYVRSGYSVDKVYALFPELGNVLGKKAGELSGGQRNMLAVGRALMSNPGVLLLDEATAGLSPQLAAALWARLVELAKDGIAVAVVEQNVAAAMQWAHDVVLLTSGRIRLQGPASELSSTGELDRLFLEAEHVDPAPVGGK